MGGRDCNVGLQERRSAEWCHKALTEAVAAPDRGRARPGSAATTDANA
jgi:hypothetical protein